MRWPQTYGHQRLPVTAGSLEPSTCCISRSRRWREGRWCWELCQKSVVPLQRIVNNMPVACLTYDFIPKALPSCWWICQLQTGMFKQNSDDWDRWLNHPISTMSPNCSACVQHAYSADPKSCTTTVFFFLCSPQRLHFGERVRHQLCQPRPPSWLLYGHQHEGGLGRDGQRTRWGGRRRRISNNKLHSNRVAMRRNRNLSVKEKQKKGGFINLLSCNKRNNKN